MEPVLFRKYKNNRRLYDTRRRRYVNMDEIEALVRRLKPVRIVDAKTGRDLTNSVLLQIILNRAKAGPSAFLPTEFLTQLIQYKGKSVGDFYRNVVKVGSSYLSAFQKGMGGTRKIVETALEGIKHVAQEEDPSARREVIRREVVALRSRLDGLEKSLGFGRRSKRKASSQEGGMKRG